MNEHMDFGMALLALKAGQRVARAGWNGRGMFIYLNRGSHDSDNDVHQELIAGVPRSLFDDGHTGTATRMPNINMLAAGSVTVTGWLASQTDMLASDWELVE